MSATVRHPATLRARRPGAGAPGAMFAAQAATELRLALRNGEQVLLTLVIPVLLLVGLTVLDVVPLPEPRVAAVTPSVLALAVMSTAFTSQAIALGFDRRYGVIRRLAATALPRWLLVAGRLAAVLATVAVQVVVLAALAAVLGWRPAAAGLGWALLLVCSAAPPSGRWACCSGARCGRTSCWRSRTPCGSCCCWQAGSSCPWTGCPGRSP